MSSPLTQYPFLNHLLAVRNELKIILSKTNNQHLKDCWPKWEHILDDLEIQTKEQPEVSISLVGGTGSGKTTLLNALLGWRLLPTKEGQPCTSAVSEIAYSEKKEFTAEVTFISRSEWDAEVERLKEDLAASLPSGDEDEEDKKVASGLIKIALQKLKAIHQVNEEVDGTFFLFQKHSEPESVQNALANGKEILTYPSDQKEEFANHLKLFLAADQPYWPIVKTVQIYGPFEALRGGIRLIDLPGINDPNEAREQILREHLKNCKFVWMIFNIKRALTRDVVQLMQSEEFFRQIVMDGRFERLTFIGTHADDVNFEEACKQYNLDQDVPVEEILQSRKVTLRNTIRNTINDLVYRLAESGGEDRLKAQSLSERLSDFRLFSVSARDFLVFVRKKARERVRDNPRLESEAQTELPALLEHVSELAKGYGVDHHNQLLQDQLTALIREADREIRSELMMLDQQLELTATQRQEVQKAAEAAGTFLDFKLNESRQGYERELTNSRSVLSGRFQLGVERGRQEVEYTLTRWGGIHHKTLGAICRNGGRTHTSKGSHDFPGDLAKPLLNSIALAWGEYFGDQLTLIMDKWVNLLQDQASHHAKELLKIVETKLQVGSTLRDAMKDLHERTQRVLAEQLAQSRGQLQKSIDDTRMKLHERIPNDLRVALRPAFLKAGAEKGKGMKHRIIEDHLRPAVISAAHTVLHETSQQIEQELRALQATLTQGYGAMISTVKSHAEINIKNLWHGAHELSTEAIEFERRTNQEIAAGISKLLVTLPSRFTYKSNRSTP